MADAGGGRLRRAWRAWFGGGWFGRGRTRALLSLGVVCSLGVVGTTAYWTDTAQVHAGSISSGTMDLQLQTPGNGSAWVLQGTGGSVTDVQLAVSDLTPGESHAFDLGVRNVGSASFSYTATVTQAGTWTFVDDPVTVRFHAGRATEDTTLPIQETCDGAALSASPVPVTTGSTTVVPGRALMVDTHEQLCVVVAMATGASNENQGRTGSLRLDFTATQAVS